VTGLTNWTNIGAAWNVPVFVGEFGRPNTDTGTPAYIQSIWNAFDTLGLSGTQWEYSITSQLWNSEDFSLVADDGGENPVAAEIIRPFARAVAGSAVTQAFNPTSQTFTLSFTPESGVSEVSLPTRAYPAGYNVAMTGGCFDVTSKPGTMLVQPTASASAVSVTVTPKP
jgi:endoglycosylceramidase